MRFTRLPLATRTRIVDCYIEDLTASQAARLLKINRKTVNVWYAELRGRIASILATMRPIRDVRVFAGYHERRIQRKNGLFDHVRSAHRTESRLRYLLKHRFKTIVRRSAKNLLV